MKFDVFNGDADGVLARHQYRLIFPEKNLHLVSGLKRDIQLLRQVEPVEGLEIKVFDISLESNEPEARALLGRGASMEWFDHHARGHLADGQGLLTHIDLSPHCCSSLIVDAHLEGRARTWAIAGAFGDNLAEVAMPLALKLHLTSYQIEALKLLGETLNYNGYGEARSDMAAWPVDLARELSCYSDPWAYMAASESFDKILEQKQADEAIMGQAEILHLSTAGEVSLLPKGKASRRMSGLYSNERVSAEPDLAHAVITHLEDETGYCVSIRAPKNRPHGAGDLASRFPGGGGRAGAGGINVLHKAKLTEFFDAFDEVFSC